MTILIAILAVVFVLGVAINIHEFGHFIVAKIFGMRVDAYSFFGLGPRIWGFKVGHTDYRISAIPLGAYVKLYGDESNTGLEAADDQSVPVPESELYELRPRWQKFLVMLGGPFMNLVLAMAIPFSLALIYGIPTTPSPIVGYVAPSGAGEKAGIKAGDRIVAFEGAENPTWQEIQDNSLLSPEKPIAVVVERNGQRVPLTLVPTKIVQGGNTLGLIDIDPEGEVEPVVADQIVPDSASAEAGLQKGDLITSFNGAPVRNIIDARQKIIDNGPNPIHVMLNRNGEAKELTMTPKADSNNVPKIGVQFGNQTKALEKVGVVKAIKYAWDSNIRILSLTVKAFGQVSKGERSAGETFSGPIGIVQIISQVANNATFVDLLFIMGLISLNLGIMNLLPIPMLDGGQIMVLGIEKFLSWFGRTLSMAVKEKIQLAGLAIVLLLMIFTTFNDISKFFR